MMFFRHLADEDFDFRIQRYSMAIARKKRHQAKQEGKTFCACDYLTAPTVKPATKRSTKKLYSMAMGMLTIRHAPMSEPQKSPRTL